jgi:glutaredoxin
VRPGATDMIFSYSTDGRKFETATSIDQIPEEARRAVVVTDLSRSPEERQAGRYVYVADLTKVREDGTHPVSIASRYGFEAKITGTSTAAGGGHEVVMYSASWCGVCRKAKRLLDQWGVRFVEKDIEASRSAQQELAAKAASAGIQPNGVPVIDVAGILLQGLDEATLKSVLEQKGFLASR